MNIFNKSGLLLVEKQIAMHIYATTIVQPTRELPQQCLMCLLYLLL